MKIFYDTEFVDDGHTIDLISIGMIAEDGRDYYAINSNRHAMRKAFFHPWLRENVLPSLPVILDSIWQWDEHHPDYQYVKHTDALAADVRDFILATPDPQLWAWYGAYDHVAYAQLFGPMSQLPAGLPMFTCDLKQRAAELGDPRIPEQETGRHNALADARHNQAISHFLDQFAAQARADTRARTDQALADIAADRVYHRDRAEKLEGALAEIRDLLRPIADSHPAAMDAATALLDQAWPTWRQFATSCDCPGAPRYHAIKCPGAYGLPMNGGTQP